MKKAFTLVGVFVLLFVFSLVAFKIFEVKSINSINTVNKYQYIQAKNHLIFLKQYIKSLNDYSSLEKITISNENFHINAHIKEQSTSYEIQLVVKAKNDKIRVQKVIFVTK